MSPPPVRIIAEAGVNHNGSVGLALELVDIAADAGADFVKFQTFRSVKIASARAVKAKYQKRTSGEEETQLSMLQRLELDWNAFVDIKKHCEKRCIGFLSTPGDIDSLRFLVNDLEVGLIKLGSGEVTNAPLLYEAGMSNANIVLSTGMATLGEVEEALGAIALGMLRRGEAPSRRAFSEVLTAPNTWSALADRVTLLHCTTEYPAMIPDTNLRAIDTMRAAFGVPVGYSDHTEGDAISIAAVARGACVIEKHFTTDRNLPGPDHLASLEPFELKSFVEKIREVEMALGNGIKQPSAAEIQNRLVVRKGLTAARSLDCGHVLTNDDIVVRRPEMGIEPFEFWRVIGSKLRQDIKEGDPITQQSIDYPE